MFNYGAKPSKVDLRDYKVKASVTDILSFELDNLPIVKNQFTVSSCVAHSSSSILEWFNKRETGEYRELSTGFIYAMQGVVFDRLEKGMYLRDACKIIQKYGDCLFETMPFNVEMPDCYERLNDKLNEEIYKEASICKVESYAKCENDETVKYALMKYSPILMSVKWYDDYKLCDDDTICFDTKTDYGYHAVMVYGFNEKGWLCQNSWGKIWGNNGRFILPYEYGFGEAWSFVDAKNDDIHKPKQNKILNVIYKAINYIINSFKLVVKFLAKKIDI
jgi:C1A family cysteine protease